MTIPLTDREQVIPQLQVPFKVRVCLLIYRRWVFPKIGASFLEGSTGKLEAAYDLCLLTAFSGWTKSFTSAG